MPSNKALTGNVVASSASGTTFLILIQLVSRIFTFLSNQLILRSLSPVVLGIAAQLELYQVSILYFSRESIRIAIQRQPLVSNQTSSGKTSPRDFQSAASQSVINVSYLSLMLGIPATLGFAMLYEYFAPAQASQIPFLKASVALTGLSSMIELSIEPFFAIIQQHMWYEKRAAVEMPAAFLRSLTTCFAFFYASRVSWDLGALPFSLGYLSYSIALVCGYCLSLLRRSENRHFSFLPSIISNGSTSEYIYSLFSRHLITLAASVFLQSIVKHLLTQGDIMFLAAMSTLEDQGIFSLASNYGGLLARIIFQPLEESSRNLFSALLSPDDRGDRSKVQIRRAKAHLIDILRAYQLMSIAIFPVGPVMVPHILLILGGRQWSSPKVVDLLSIYCQYIPFLAFNGITEAFVSSAANSLEIRKQTVWMGVFSACYGVASYFFLEVASMGAYGLVLANMVNMAVRTLWSCGFIRSYLREYGDGLNIRETCLHPLSYVLGAIATIIMTTQPKQGLVPAIAFSGGYALLLVYVEKQYLIEQVKNLCQIMTPKDSKLK